MPNVTRGPARFLALLLLVTVATQVFYITVVSAAGDDTPVRPATWLVELVTFAGIAVTGMTLAVRDPGRAVTWSLVTMAGALNILQVAMGLSMFGPAMKAAESVPQLFATILAGAFFFYFFGKVLLASAAIALCAGSARNGLGMMRALAGLVLLAGAASLATGFLALIDSKAWMFPAGASGTAVAALFALHLLVTKDA